MPPGESQIVMCYPWASDQGPQTEEPMGGASSSRSWAARRSRGCSRCAR